MYTPSILETPLRPTGPVDATRPTDSLTADWPLVDDGQVQIGIWSCTPGRFTGTTGDEHVDRAPDGPEAVRHRPAHRDARGTTHLGNASTAVLGESTPRANPIAGTPHEASLSTWTHDGLDVGVWECTPGEFSFRRDGYDEVFCVVAGRAARRTPSSIAEREAA